MTDKNEWWLKKFNEKNWGACFECCDYEGMVDDIRGILAEHTRRIVDELYRMQNDTVLDDGRFVIDEAIKRIKDL